MALNLLLDTTKKLSFCSSCLASGDLPKVVVGRGNPRARLMIIGEAPGAHEDEKGEPFVGRSGILLNKLLESVGINPEKDAYISNVIKCRPPNNRRPTKKEIDLSMPWLSQQINLVDPLVITLMGATAVKTLLGNNEPISNLRGKWQSWEGRLVMPLFHPSYLLRNPSKAEGTPFSLMREDLLDISNRLKGIRK